ncbi:uncharacterized protein LOC122506779 [Leptopilina heterotoma]|uniref:uncharacterized protein LOC122506779 n=1 Tax=Leptopilina heterotoma TaxID=63436 RepID=UPI001CA7D969|nr:uncharacterized protein LOC122506779 [Leptopilina heterotoma]
MHLQNREKTTFPEKVKLINNSSVSNTDLNEPQTIANRVKEAIRVELIGKENLKHDYKLEARDPVEILEKVKEIKRCEVNVTSVSVRKQLYAMQYNASQETANAFLDRFEELVHNYETIPDSTPLSDDEKRDALYNSIKSQVPEIQSIEFITKSQTGKSLTYDLLKSFIMQAEANKLQSNTTTHPNSKAITVASASFINSNRSNERCFECGDSGHMRNECPIKGQGLKKCYECGQFTTHIAAECPQRLAKNGKSFNKTNKANNKRSFKAKDLRSKNSSNSKPTRDGANRQFKQKGNKTSQHQSRTWTNEKLKVQQNNKCTYENSLILETKLKPQFDKRKQSLLSTHYLQKSNNKGSLNNTQSNKNYVSFIVDTGATEHLTNSSEIFSDLQKSKSSVIKCANKNSEADLVAEGQGTVNIISNSDNKKSLVLDNTIYTNSLSENLLSLRKFAEAGLSTYFDKERVKIYDPKTTEVYATGIYDKPYWVMKFKIDNEKVQQKRLNSSDVYVFETTVEPNEEKENVDATTETNETKRKLMMITKTSSPQTVDLKIDQINDNECKTITKGDNTCDLCAFTDFDTQITNRKITNLDDLPSVDLLEDDFVLNKSFTESIKESKAMLWHVRMGHASVDYLRKLQGLWKDNKELQGVVFDESRRECEICALTKLSKLPFRNQRSRATRPLQIIHSDVMGKIAPLTHPFGYQYISVFIDDFSRMALAYPMKTKDATGHCLERFIKSARNLLDSNEKFCYLRTDQGTEYMGGYTQEVLIREGIEIQPACPDTPQHNGTSERFNQTLQKKIRSIMFDSKLPQTMRDLALGAAVYVYNRTPHRTNDFKAPLEIFAPNLHYDVNQIKRFGCLAYWSIQRKPDTKFSARAVRGVLVGYTPSGYIFLNPESGKFFKSRNVRFNEKMVYGDKYGSESIRNWPDKEIERSKNEWFLKFENDDVTKVTNEYVQSRSEKFEFPSIEEEFQNTRDKASDQILHCLHASINNDPQTFKQASESKHKNEWTHAINDELDSLKRNKVWSLVDRPKFSKYGKKPNIIDSKCVFKQKEDGSGVTRFKARLVIRGFKDSNLYDLKETYAPVSRLTLVRSVLAMINFYDLEVCQLDVKTAFLNGIIKDEVYMEIPEGMEVTKEDRQTKVCKILKALYGLRISPKRWNERFTEVVNSLGLTSDQYDPCLFT